MSVQCHVRVGDCVVFPVRKRCRVRVGDYVEYCCDGESTPSVRTARRKKTRIGIVASVNVQCSRFEGITTTAEVLLR